MGITDRQHLLSTKQGIFLNKENLFLLTKYIKYFGMKISKTKRPLIWLTIYSIIFYFNTKL